MSKIIAIDFDDVLMSKGTPDMVKACLCAPMDRAVDSVRCLLGMGHHVVVLTARKELAPVKAWVTRHIDKDILVTNTKMFAHVYVDDRALRFLCWEQTLLDTFKLLQD